MSFSLRTEVKYQLQIKVESGSMCNFQLFCTFPCSCNGLGTGSCHKEFQAAQDGCVYNTPVLLMFTRHNMVVYSGLQFTLMVALIVAQELPVLGVPDLQQL